MLGFATEPLGQAMSLVSEGQSLYAAERYAEALDPLEKALGSCAVPTCSPPGRTRPPL